MIRSCLILLGQIVFAISLYSQNVSFKTYSHANAASTLRFSMDIPQSWKEISELDGNGYFQSFIETDTTGKATRKLCLDSVIYKLKHFSVPIPQAMAEMGFRDRGGNIFMYELNDFINVVVGFEMKGNNYNGLNCSFKTKLTCEGKKSKKKSDTEIVCLFFSNGAETICITGNGIPLEDSVLENIKSTFRFN